ncbi:MAG: lycopene cyclase domain-containing protein [Chloroflexota bacterium]
MGHWTYLIYELTWALPIILGQWFLAHRIFRANLRLILMGIALPTLYLCAADALAIRVGIWSLNPELTLNVWLGGLPLEEGVFFLVTNIMVVQGIVMLVCKQPADKVSDSQT